MAKREIGNPPSLTSTSQPTTDLLVGMGASAGGLDAVKAFLGKLPRQSGLSIALIQHLDTGGQDALIEAIGRSSPIPIVVIADKMPIRPDTLFVAPARGLVSVEKNLFRVETANHDRRLPTAIDHFFHSLATQLASNAVGVVLSGAGTDGTLGLKAISDAGGMTIAQSPQTAKFDSMPRSAATTGVADHILPPEDMPAELASYRHHLQISQGEMEKQLRHSIIEAIPEVAKVLQSATDHDFRHYKPSTLTRRIQRRMQLLKVATVAEYVAALESNPEECKNLFRELLIGVTEFFRDKEAFEFLERNVIPKLFEGRSPGDQIRVWCAGCSTGEEAYSIAMLVRSFIDTLEDPPLVRIFATDIDERALEIARQGIYPLGIAEDVSRERLDRFFVKRGRRFQVSKEIRELCVFSQHNLISDPPFSRQDLICCRNLLIYLGAHLQKKIIPLFHYSLRPGGFLFLGPSEGMESHKELFQQLHPKYRISHRKGTALPPPALLSRERPPSGVSTAGQTKDADSLDLPRLMQRIVLDEFSPPSVVINGDGNILCTSGDVSSFLTISIGTFQNNIVKLARPGLRVGLRTALREAKAKKRQITDDSLSVRLHQKVQQVMLTVQPMPEMGEDSGLYLVVFQSVGLPQRKDKARTTSRDDEADTLVDQLERELHETRDELERTIQDLEAANEELKSSNEELLSMNEELQSTNEEMETSKEELQNVNQSLARANCDLQNLLSSTRIATLFLDGEGCIRNFTPAIADIYRVISTDIGRPLDDINTHAVDMPSLPTYDELIRLGQVEHEIRTVNDEWFIRRVSLYTSETESNEGMVITFANVTGLKRTTASLKKSELDLLESQKRLNFILASARVGTWIWRKSTDEVSWSDNLEEIHGRKRGSFGGTFQSVFEDIIPEDRARVEQTLQTALANQDAYRVQYRILWPDGSIRWLEADGQANYDAQGELVSMSGLCRDITERKQSEQRLLAEHAVSHAIAEGRNLLESTPQLMQAFAQHLDVDACELWLPDEADEDLRIIASYIKEPRRKELARFEERGRTLRAGNGKGESVAGAVWKSGAPVWALDDNFSTQLIRSKEAAKAGLRSAVSFPILADQKTIGAFTFYARHRIPETEELAKMMQAIGLDIGQLVLRARAESSIRASEARFRTLANVVPALVWTSDADRNCNYFNQQWLEFTGRSLNQELGRGWTKSVHPDDAERRLRTFEDAFDKRQAFRMEYRLKRHDGEYRWLIDEGSPMFDADGALVGYIGACLDITDTKETEFALRQAGDQRRLALQAADIGLWDWDLVKDSVFLDSRCRELLGIDNDERVNSQRALSIVHPEDRDGLEQALEKAIDPSGIGSFQLEYRVQLADNSIRWIAALGEVSFEGEGFARRAARFVSTLQDITPRKRAEEVLHDHARTLEIINDVTLQLAGELDLDTLVQSVTDAGRELSGAQFGAFFYNKVSDAGESYTLYSISGVPREAFDSFPMPRNTKIFSETFSGRGVTRSDDITKDPRYGKMPPHFGMPEGHLPVRSYLSVPVIGRDGKTIGGLFYGHEETGVFSEQHAKILRGIAAQAAVAVENARLYTSQRESEQRYRHLLHTGHDAVYVYPVLDDGTPGAFIDVNDQAIAQLGFSREEFLKMTPFDVMDVSAAEKKSIYLRVVEAGTLIVQNRHRAKDGRIIPVEVSATVVQLDGRPHVVSKARDITDRLKVEEDLRRSERLYRGIGESMNYGIWICDAEGRNLYTSESLLELIGMTQEEASEFGWGKVLHPDDAEETLSDWKACSQEGDFWEREHRMLGVDGTYHYVLARGVPIRDEKGSIIQWAGINLDIDHLKQTESALRGSEARFKTYFESSPTPLWEKDWSAVRVELNRLAIAHPDLRKALLDQPELARMCLQKTRIIDANPAAVKLFNATDRSDMIENGDRIVTNRTPESMAEILCALHSGGNRFRMEEEIITFEGEKRHVLCEFVALAGHEASLERALVSRVDITDRKRAEQATALTAAVGSEMASGLVYDKTLLKLARTVVPEFADWCAVDLVESDGSLKRIATVHDDPKQLAIAEQLTARYGSANDDRIGVSAVLESRETNWVREIPSELIQSVIKDEEQLRFIKSLGLRSYICVPLIARDTVLGAITFVTAESGRRYDLHDVSVANEIARHASQAIDNAKLYQSQINALREAREAQSLLDTIIATAPVGVALLDRDLRFVQVNNVMAEMNSLTPDDHKGLSFKEALPDIWPQIKRLCRNLLAGSEGATRLEFKRADNDAETERSFVYTFYPIRSAHGDIVGIGTLVEEVTERKRFEETLASARQQAEAANQSKSEFLANMSHEIRTPMTSILGYSDILRQNLEDPDDIQCVNTIRRNGEFLLEIINDILDLSRIESGHLEVDLERCQPDVIVADVVSLMEVRAKEKRLDLQVEFNGDVPETIETDPVRLRQILVNLVGNAVKFTDKGSVRLVLRFMPERELMRCDIIDTGIGIPSEQLKRIFQPFRQADTSVSRRFGGSGLGLTICDRLVQMLGGTIEATSKVDEGSVFSFTIRTGALSNVPLVKPRNLHCTSVSGSEATGTQVSLNCRALVVDDRREIRQLAQHYIEEAGGTAITAENGVQCLEIVERAEKDGMPFDIVVIDMQMPVMDGYEATRRLRSSGFAKPIIALTAHAMKGDRQKSINAGCDDYATKPIDDTTLIGLIAKHASKPADAGADETKPASNETRSSVAQSPQAAPKNEKSRRVLIVEDYVSLRRILALTFEKRGHDVRVAPTAAAALEIAQTFRPQVAVMDLGLPDMSGHELVALLRKMPEMKDARLIALSGRDDPKDISKSEEAGFDQHVVKPPDVNALEELFYGDAT